MANKVINAVWAQNTSNKSIFTEEQIGLGIAYQGSVVSDQLNGVANILYQAAAYQQRSGGYYAPDKIYYKNDVCSIMHISPTHPLTLEFYRCLSNNKSGIQGVPPITGGDIDTTGEVTIFQNGQIDTINWQRVDSGGLGSNSYSIANPDSTQVIQFLRVNPINHIEGQLQDINTKVSFIVITQEDKVCTFDVSITGRFVLLNGNIKFMSNGYGDPLPNIAISNVQHDYDFTPEDAIDSAIDDLLLYGVRFEAGKTVGADPIYGIYIKARDDIKQIIANSSNEAGVTLSLDTQTSPDNYDSLMWLPVIDGVGKNYDNIGKLFEVDFEPSKLAVYNWGAIDTSVATNLADPKYGLFNRKYARSATLTHESCHTRVGGGTQLADITTQTPGTALESGVPNITGGLRGIRGTENIKGADGAFRCPSMERYTLNGGPYYYWVGTITFDASRVSTLYKSNLPDVRPLAIIIKRFITIYK